jgi:23S rRNA (uracil1939-C5)-methyltransferase
MPYEEQLSEKRRLVAEAFARHFPSGDLPEIDPVVPSPKVEGYRASAKLALSHGRKGVSVGVYRRGTHDVADIPYCPVHHPLVASGVRALRSVLGKAPGLVSQGRGGEGWLRYAVFQASEEEQKLLVTLVTRTGEGEGLLRSLAARLKEIEPNLSGLAWNVNDTAGNEIFGDQWRMVWGEDRICERFGDVRLSASAGAFLQVNRQQAGRVYREGVELLSPRPDEDAVDIFCGVGGFAFHLASRVKSVVGLEANPRAVADARAQAAASGVGNATFHAGAAEELLPQIARQGLRPGVAVLNPARKGAEARVLEELRVLRPRAILYVSCNPETLARDASILCSGGLYRIETIRPFDFFPQTDHVETLLTLRLA